jgi:hypothetical protein
MVGYSPKTWLWVLQLACVLVALGLGAAAHAQSLQIAASNWRSDDSSLIYSVTANTSTEPSAPPSLILAPLGIPRSLALGYNSLAYVPSGTPGVLDLIASASDGLPTIFRFFGPNYTTAQSVWCPSSSACTSLTTGPSGGIIAMAVDASGTLYVLSTDPGKNTCSLSSAPTEIWAFRQVPSSASGFAATPILIDAAVAGPSCNGQRDYSQRDYSQRDYSQNNIDSLSFIALNEGDELTPMLPPDYTARDLVIAPAGVGAPVTAGDVLVLFGWDNVYTQTPVIADYNHSTVQNVLNGSALPYGSSSGGVPAPVTVANSFDISPLAIGGDFYEVPVSMAFWPSNSSVLLLTNMGNIYNFTWAPNTNITNYPSGYAVGVYQQFASGLTPSNPDVVGGYGYCHQPSTQNEVLRTANQAGQSYAFVAANTCGTGRGYGAAYPSYIWSMDGINPPVRYMETEGDLAGLAVSAAISTIAHNGSGTGAGCAAPMTCNITGGDTQSLAGPGASQLTAADTITENVCTVTTDPRQICPPGIPSNPYYNSRELPVAAVCPNLPSGGAGSSVIPDYLCGGYGPGGAGSGTGFAVIQGIANGVNKIPGLLNLNDTNPDAFFPPGGTSECSPTGIFVDNISAGWGPWSLSPVEGTIPEGNRLIELSDGCGGDKETTSGMSLTLLGVTLDLANATQELGALPKTLANFAEFKYINLDVELAEDPIDLPNKVRIVEIITQSALFLAARKIGCAEDTLYEADRYVINNASHFHGTPARDPNSYGRTRARILNLFYTLFTREDGNVNPITGNNVNVNIPLLAPSLTGPPASCSVPYLGRDGY